MPTYNYRCSVCEGLHELQSSIADRDKPRYGFCTKGSPGATASMPHPVHATFTRVPFTNGMAPAVAIPRRHRAA